jgi:hypothetical protein
LVLTLTAAGGCANLAETGSAMLSSGALNGRPGAAGAASQAKPDAPPSKEAVEAKKRVDALHEQQLAAIDGELEKLEKDTLTLAKFVLGREPAFPGAPAPDAASASLASLKKSKITLSIGPSLDADGVSKRDDFLELKDSFTERAVIIAQKMGEHRATKAEQRSLQRGAKYVGRLNQLKQQVTMLSLQLMKTNQRVQVAGLETMFVAAEAVGRSKLDEKPVADEDYAAVRRKLDQQRRAEAIAATTMALTAAFEAAVNDKSDPAAIDTIAEGVLRAFPAKISASDEDAKKLVKEVGGDLQTVKARYEAGLRRVYGDARYEKYEKAPLERMFAQAEALANTKSKRQRQEEIANDYNADVVRCKQGQPAKSAIMSPVTCKNLRHAFLTGDTSDLLPGALKAFEETGGRGAGGAAAPPMVAVKLGARESAAAAGAQAALSGDADGVLDSAMKLFPGDTAVGGSLRGLDALRKGDAVGAINAALSFVPIPGLKDAFRAASNVFKTANAVAARANP